jgi:predicted membrane-bound spermidine synthase
MLIHTVSKATVNASLAVTVAANFGLLLFPTALMGATLPILVRRIVRSYRNIGVSVGVLYFANTLGAAFGAGLAGFVALYYLGLTRTIYLAVGLNILVGATVWLNLRRSDA